MLQVLLILLPLLLVLLFLHLFLLLTLTSEQWVVVNYFYLRGGWCFLPICNDSV